jgi:hypothetical protein
MFFRRQEPDMTVTKEMIEAAKAETAEEVLGLLTAHELYQYRPKAFQGFIDYVRKHFAAASLSRSAEAGKPVVKGWQDIETAPTNGKIVMLAWSPDDWTTGQGFYRDGKWVAVGTFYNHAAGKPPYEFRQTVVAPKLWQELSGPGSALSTPADIEPVADGGRS